MINFGLSRRQDSFAIHSILLPLLFFLYSQIYFSNMISSNLRKEVITNFALVTQRSASSLSQNKLSLCYVTIEPFQQPSHLAASPSHQTHSLLLLTLPSTLPVLFLTQHSFHKMLHWPQLKHLKQRKKWPFSKTRSSPSLQRPKENLVIDNYLRAPGVCFSKSNYICQE